MNKPIIRRYFAKDVFTHIEADFGFLINRIVKSGFEYDLQIRENYFNLYYKGNSLAKVVSKRSSNEYEISIHTKFFSETGAHRDTRFPQPPKGNYFHLTVPSKLLTALFQQRYLEQFSSKIKEVGFQEETTFEQMLITDNINRPEFIIIDRQVMDAKNPTKMDLLALEQVNDEDYQFCVIEVKLGNNPELRDKVAGQLTAYTERISDNFADYKECYELNFKQKRQLGLFKNQPKIESVKNITIVEGVSGVVVVGGYSGIARNNINKLKKLHPDTRVMWLTNRIDRRKLV